MKVLILTERGDSSRYWEASLPLLRKKGIDAHLATIKEHGELCRKLQNTNVPTHSFGSRNAIDYPTVSYSISKLIQSEEFDVIHACEAIPAFVAGMSSMFGNSAKRIFNRQHNMAHGKQRLLSFLGSKMSHLIMPVSISSGESAQKYDWVKPDKIKIAYSGIEMLREVGRAEIAELRSQLNIPEGAKVISMVAHLREEKGQSILFDACDKISRNLNDPLHLVLTGSGEDESKLRDLAESNHRFTTHFSGFQSDVALWFSIGDVVAMPSYHEAFGLSAVEAMSCALPLVASDVGGLSEIIESEISGILVPPRDSSALADSVLRVLENPDFAKRIGNHARLRVEEKFSLENMVDSWIDCYHFVKRYKN